MRAPTTAAASASATRLRRWSSSSAAPGTAGHTTPASAGARVSVRVCTCAHARANARVLGEKSMCARVLTDLRQSERPPDVRVRPAPTSIPPVLSAFP